MGPDDTHTCYYDQLFMGFKIEIDGVVHGVQYIWDANYIEENWGFLIFDAKKNFDDNNIIRILWTVCHLWSSGARFV